MEAIPRNTEEIDILYLLDLQCFFSRNFDVLPIHIPFFAASSSRLDTEWTGIRRFSQEKRAREVLLNDGPRLLRPSFGNGWLDIVIG